MQLLTHRALFLVQCLDLPEAAHADGAKWERFQIAHLNDDSLFRIEDKSRQIAWSFTVAAEAVANAVLDAQSTVFVSINLDEAQEKVRYAQYVYDNLNISTGLPPIIRKNIFSLEFGNGARLLSLPSRPPRGKARMNIVLDEFAHVQHDKDIYTAAMPIITRGGKLRIGSSPMGATGTFWEISQQELNEYPGFNRVRTPWWRVRGFCRDGVCPRGTAEAMTTLDRVNRFGSDRIQILFNNMLLEDFQQEYECMYIDEATSFFTWGLIRNNQRDDKYRHILKGGDDVERVVRLMKSEIAAGSIESVLVGGMDVGRKRHLSEICFVGINPLNTPVRLTISLDKVPFDRQERILRHILRILPVKGLLIDQSGLGLHMAENLEADTIARGVDFTNESKHRWATELRIQFERTSVPIPVDRDLAYQIHSVKRLVTAAKHTVFDTDRNEKHHADKFWALALAVWAARERREAPEWGPPLQRGR